MGLTFQAREGSQKQGLIELMYDIKAILQDNNLNIVAPALVKPFSSQETIFPEIVRFLLSAAVSVTGKLIFIGLSLLPLGFAQRVIQML